MKPLLSIYTLLAILTLLHRNFLFKNTSPISPQPLRKLKKNIYIDRNVYTTYPYKWLFGSSNYFKTVKKKTTPKKVKFVHKSYLIIFNPYESYKFENEWIFSLLSFRSLFYTYIDNLISKNFCHIRGWQKKKNKKEGVAKRKENK